MNDEHQAREAARALAARRRITTKRCARCGQETVGIATRRYCSASCRAAAAKQNDAPAEAPGSENIAPRSKLTREGIERMSKLRERISQGRTLDDSTEILREEREARSAYLESIL